MAAGGKPLRVGGVKHSATIAAISWGVSVWNCRGSGQRMTAHLTPLVMLSASDIMFSMQATAQELQRLLEQTSPTTAKHLGLAPSVLPLGLEAFDEVLPDSGLPRGQVIEVAVSPGSGLATSVGLWACRAAQIDASHQGSETWCAFVDPSGSLFAPGVASAGVELERLLVVRPSSLAPIQRSTKTRKSGQNREAVESSLAGLNRIAVKLAEARLFSVLVVDLVGATWSPGRTRTAPLEPRSLSQWGKSVRRMAMAVAGTATQVILLTDKAAPRTLPLPVALRLELQQLNPDRLQVTIAKEKRGRISAPKTIQLNPTPSEGLSAKSTAPAHLDTTEASELNTNDPYSSTAAGQQPLLPNVVDSVATLPFLGRSTLPPTLSLVHPSA